MTIISIPYIWKLIFFLTDTASSVNIAIFLSFNWKYHMQQWIVGNLDAGLAEVLKWDPKRAGLKTDVENWDAVKPFIMNAHLKDTRTNSTLSRLRVSGPCSSFISSRLLRASVHAGQRAEHHHDRTLRPGRPRHLQRNNLSLKPMTLTSETSSIKQNTSIQRPDSTFLLVQQMSPMLHLPAVRSTERFGDDVGRSGGFLLYE